ncbi:MAG: serine/threonine protein kinase [Verrucomicrobia bacterium]|nr:serine/threonine protein kinase [Verrucomicrobiota bacterium]
MIRTKTVIHLVSAGLLLSTASADDWPQWQGPQRNAISKETGLLKEWPKDGPPLAWKAKGLGGGDSAPSISAGKLYGMANRGADEVVWALSEKDGKELWVSRLGPAFEQRGMPQSKEGPGGTPTVDGERLYVIGMGGDVSCLQVSDGKILWQKSMTRDFGGRVPTWSFRESPLVDGDKVICTPGAQEAMLVALDKLTGNTIWKSQMPASPAGPAGETGGPGGGRRGFGGRGGGSGAAYASVIAIDFEGQRQHVQLTAKALIGVSASDGKFLWRYDRPANGNGINCSTPLYHDGKVFAASAYGAGGGLVKLSKDGNGGIKAEEGWFSRNIQNHHGGVVLIDGALYGGNGGNGTGYLVCLNFQTGEVLWNEGDPDKRRVRKGSVAVADGRIYYRNDTEARGAADEMILIEPSRKEYIERGRFRIPDPSGAHSWSHPVVANGKLYVRDQDTLFCYNVKAAVN